MVFNYWRINPIDIFDQRKTIRWTKNRHFQVIPAQKFTIFTTIYSLYLIQYYIYNFIERMTHKKPWTFGFGTLHPIFKDLSANSKNFNMISLLFIITLSIHLVVIYRLFEFEITELLLWSNKREDLRNFLVLQGVSALWHLAQWVSRAPPNHILPAFLNLNGRQIGASLISILY